jgi:DNA-binding protein H-NS
MKRSDLVTMTMDELWLLRDEIGEILTAKLAREKNRLEARLKQLTLPAKVDKLQKKSKRPYPKVRPKFRNPDKPSQTWAGRGKMPRWLKEKLSSGKRIEDFLISHPERGRRRP